MEKVLVTGAAGFIGSHLTQTLLESGVSVKAFVRYNSSNNCGWLDRLGQHENLEIYRGDIRDFDSVNEAVSNVDTVFHLAALIGIPYSYISPLAYIKTNVEGTYNVLESCRRMNIERVIVTSTSETYGTAKYVPMDENHPLVGQSPYSASKIGADQLAISYYRSFGVPVSVVRPFNTFGPRQSNRAIIPTIITQLLKGYKEISLGNLSPTRDFVYVKDTVKGFMKIALAENTIGETVNIANQNEISMNQLAIEIRNQISPDAIITSKDNRFRPEKSEVQRLYGNNQKLLNLTGWTPEYSFSDGIEETIKWFSDKSNLSLYKANKYNF